MPKAITSLSRDAREFCAKRAQKKLENEPFFALEECWQNLCRRLLADEEAWKKSDSEPLLCSEAYLHPGLYDGVPSDVNFWLFKNRLFLHDEELDFSDEEWKLLVREEFDKERRQFEKLQAKFSGLTGTSQVRSTIPSRVRIFVWQRDGGRCVECGSNENLEYDHIIPFVRGGSNTERNLQLLCGNCNRLKSDNIQ